MLEGQVQLVRFWNMESLTSRYSTWKKASPKKKTCITVTDQTWGIAHAGYCIIHQHMLDHRPNSTIQSNSREKSPITPEQNNVNLTLDSGRSWEEKIDHINLLIRKELKKSKEVQRKRTGSSDDRRVEEWRLPGWKCRGKDDVQSLDSASVNIILSTHLRIITLCYLKWVNAAAAGQILFQCSLVILM